MKPAMRGSGADRGVAWAEALQGALPAGSKEIGFLQVPGTVLYQTTSTVRYSCTVGQLYICPGG